MCVLMDLFIFPELECLDKKCLARTKNVLIDLLGQLEEEISSCEITESGMNFDYEVSKSEGVKDLFNICHNCSAYIQKVGSIYFYGRSLLYRGQLEVVKKLQNECFMDISS